MLPRRLPGAPMACAVLAALPILSSCATAGKERGAGPEAAAAAAAPKAGARRADARGIEQVWVPPGSFRMGTDDGAMQVALALSPPAWVLKALPREQPQHPVRLTTGYWIDVDEVTNASFQAFVDAGGYADASLWSEEGRAWLANQGATGRPHAAIGGPRHPRVDVTWHEASAYARWRGGRLPSEAEWEFAARGPEASTYPWGDAFDPARCNVVGSTASEPVGAHPDGASWVGARDMAGNAMEWVRDWLAPYDAAAGEQVDPAGPAAGTVKVEKGGWWGSHPVVARGAYRHFEDPPEYSDHHIGFRIVSP